MLKQTPKKRVLFVRRFTPVLLALFGVFSMLLAGIHSPKLAMAADLNSTVNFQARLQTASGAIVPDGDYNVEFKLYSAKTGGSALWTEDYTSTSGPTGNDVRLHTVNGYLSTSLGSINPFSSTINWSQQLWVTMNIGGTGTGTYPSVGDGEMNPRLQLTAVPYAFQAGQLAQSNSDASFLSTLSIQAPTGGNQLFVLQDQGANGTYNILTAPDGSDGYIKLQGSSPSAQAGYFNIDGTGIAGTLQANTFDAATATTLNIGTSTATDVILGSTSSGFTTTINGGTTSTDTGAISVQAGSGGLITIGTENSNNVQLGGADGFVGIGADTPTRQLDINIDTSADNAPPILVRQTGTGDADIELQSPSQSFYLGVDNSDDSKFKISSSTANGDFGRLGYASLGANLDTGSGGLLFCQKTTANTTGTITGASMAYGTPIDPFNNLFKMALYTDGSGAPGTLITESSEGTATDGWNDVTLSASVTDGTVYWLCAQSNTTTRADNNPYYDTGAAAPTVNQTVTYGTWPTGGWSNGGSVFLSMYANITASTESDSFSKSLFTLDTAGAATFQNSADTTKAFQVQNANGIDVLNVDTTGSAVSITGTGQASIALQAPSFDTASSGTLTIGGTHASSITIGQTGSNIRTTINGTALVKPTGGNDSTTVFQVQNASSANMFDVDSANQQILIGPSGGDTVGTLLVLGNKTNAGDPTEVDGAMYYNSSMGGFRCGVSGTWQSCIGGLLKANTSVQAGDTISNTTSETNFATNYTIPANYCVPGRVIRLTATGVWSANGTPNFTFRVKLGATVVGSNTGHLVAVANMPWRVDFQIICDDVPSGSSNVEAQGQINLWSGTQASNLWSMSNTAPIAIATNTSQALEMSTQFDTADPSNAMTMRQFIVEGLGP
jgi:hypothetical protein